MPVLNRLIQSGPHYIDCVRQLALTHRQVVRAYEPVILADTGNNLRFLSISSSLLFMSIESSDRRKFIPSVYRDRARQIDLNILKLWDKNSESWLIHTHIAGEMEKSIIPKHIVVRALERLVRENKLEKKEDGRSTNYRLRMKPP